jgi:hypothetical protein
LLPSFAAIIGPVYTALLVRLEWIAACRNKDDIWILGIDSDRRNLADITQS